MSDRTEILIVGGGPAAHGAIEAYFDAGGAASILMLTAEPELPYERPPLTKHYLRGESSRGDLPLADQHWYEERGVAVERDSTVVELDLDAGEAGCADGRRFGFDRCLLASGARPLLPEIPGADGPGVRVVRTIEDSERLRALAEGSVVIVGSGFIGCEAAASLAALGAEVRVATLESSPQVDRLGEEAAARIAAWLAERGIDLLTEAELGEIVPEPEGSTVRFKDGKEAYGEGVVLALGIERNDELAAAAGVEVENGVLVDSAMVSSNPSLLACGDVAAALNSAAGRRLRVEHWGEALNMGKVAGRTLAASDANWDVAPGFWSTIGEETLKYVGWGDGWEDVSFVPAGNGGFVARYGREGELVGVLAHEDDRAYERGREEIEARASWS